MGVTDVNSWTQCWCRRALWLGLGVGALAAPRVGAQVFVWDGGDYVTVVGAGHTTISSGETLNITLSADHFFVATALVNNGTTNWQDGGPLRAWSGASYTNNAAFNDQNVTDAVMYPTYDNSLYFSNSSSGVYTKSGAGTTTYNVVFNNDGTVIVQSGTLAFAAGGANNGTFVTSAGAKTQFLNDYTLNAGSSLTGAGNYALDGGTATFNGTVTVTHLLLNSGAMGGTQTFNNSTLEWTGTSLGTSGTTIIGGTSVLNISGSGDKVFNLRAVVNNGTTNWTGGPLRAWSGGSLTNNAAFNDQNSSNAIAYPTYDSSFYFQNSLGATYTKSGASTTTFDVPFNNAGAVFVQAGTFTLAGGGANTGTFTTNSAATTEFTNDYSIGAGSSLTGLGVYALNAGTVTFSGAVTVTHLLLNSGTLAGTQTFSNSTLDWGSAGLSTSGTTTIAGSSILNITTSADHLFNLRTIVNNGVVNWSGDGALRSWSGGSFTNNATFNDLNAGAVQAYWTYDNSFYFANSVTGTYTKSGVGSTTFAVTFNNDGAVAVQAGTLVFSGGGTNTGSIVTSGGAFTRFVGDYALSAGSLLTGAGLYSLDSNTFFVNGAVTVTHLALANGALAGTHTFNNSTLDWTSTSLGTSGATTIAGTSVLNILGSGDHVFNLRSITNNGVVNWTGGGALRGWSGAAFVNNAGFNDQNSVDASMYPTYDNSLVFTNSSAGVYTKAGAANTTFAVPLDNAGSILVQAGTLTFAAGGTNTGTMSTSAGATTAFTNDYALSNGSALTGLGFYVLNAGTLVPSGSVTLTHLVMNGGALGGTQVFDNSTLDWIGASWGTSGSTTIASTSVLNILGAGDHLFLSRGITNNGVVTWSGGGALRGWSGASFVNNGVFLDQNNTGAAIYPTYDNSLTFTNHGTYAKAGSGTTAIQVDSSNTGIISVSGGVLSFQAGFSNVNGSFALANGATVSLPGAVDVGTGSLTGSGTVQSSSVDVSGLVQPGQLLLTGDLTLRATSILAIFVGGNATPGIDYGHVGVTGNGTLNGSLYVTFSAGFQGAITAADTFTILTSGSTLAGAFSNVANGSRLNTTDNAGTFQVNYGVSSSFAGSAVVLSNFIPVPEPSTYVLVSLGLGALGFAARRRG